MINIDKIIDPRQEGKTYNDEILPAINRDIIWSNKRLSYSD